MSELIQKYRSTDGSEWSNRDDAEKRDRLCSDVDAAMSGLPEVNVSDTAFVQHQKEILWDVRRKLYEIVKREFAWFLKDKPNMQNADDVHPYSIVGRVISDSDLQPIDRAWGRLMRCNFENCREYEQPFYALNPEKADQ